jgi:rhamnogalacturonyl hydrolase YesR
MSIDSKLVGAMVGHSNDMIARNLKPLKNQPKKFVKKLLLERTIKYDPFFWNNGVLVFAINKYNEKVSDKYTSKSLGLLLAKKNTIELVDNTFYYYANYSQIDKATRDMVFGFLSHYERDEAGSILYRVNDSAAFLDTLGMVCPFLFRYGKEYRNEKAVELAMTQFRAFFLNGMDKSSGLPYHGYDISNHEKSGIIGWGRGIGWMLFGLCESLAWVDKGSENYRELNGYILGLLDNILKYQKEDGSFSWQLQATNGPSDSSVTGMIGYSIVKYAKNEGREDFYEDIIIKIGNAILGNVEANGVVFGSSAECQGFSMYPQRFDNNSWGQAFCTLFLIELMDLHE